MTTSFRLTCRDQLAPRGHYIEENDYPTRAEAEKEAKRLRSEWPKADGYIVKITENKMTIKQLDMGSDDDVLDATAIDALPEIDRLPADAELFDLSFDEHGYYKHANELGYSVYFNSTAEIVYLIKQ